MVMRLRRRDVGRRGKHMSRGGKKTMWISTYKIIHRNDYFVNVLGCSREGFLMHRGV